MAARLIPCPSCSRHVKLGPPSCPFCGGDVSTDVAPRAVSLPVGRPLTRAAIALAGAAAVSACSSSSSSPAPISDAGGDSADVGMVALYGVAVLPDASDSAVPDTGTAALYGPAILPDAGLGDAGDAGQAIAAYGVAMIPDASEQ